MVSPPFRFSWVLDRRLGSGTESQTTWPMPLLDFQSLIYPTSLVPLGADWLVNRSAEAVAVAADLGDVQAVPLDEAGPIPDRRRRPC